MPEKEAPTENGSMQLLVTVVIPTFVIVFFVMVTQEVLGPSTSQMLTARVSSAVCGNGTVEEGEECDDGNTNPHDSCTHKCKPNVCGDSILFYEKEECDDGNTFSRDGCSKFCSIEVSGRRIPRTVGRCGNGEIEPQEKCDDGNTTDGDGCSGECTIEDADRERERRWLCGDGDIDGTEECDEGPANNDSAPDACRKDCRFPRCGDGVVDFRVRGERCDDGNERNGDGCSSTCQVEQAKVTPIEPSKPALPAPESEPQPELSSETQSYEPAHGAALEPPTALGFGADTPAGSLYPPDIVLPEDLSPLASTTVKRKPVRTSAPSPAPPKPRRQPVYHSVTTTPTGPAGILFLILSLAGIMTVVVFRAKQTVSP